MESIMSQHAAAAQQQQKQQGGKVVIAQTLTRTREVIDGKTGEIISTKVIEPKQ